jgi:hypothetical protein
MSARLERLAASALQGLCASPKHAPDADPHTGDALMVAKRAMALAVALDAELGPDTETSGPTRGFIDDDGAERRLSPKKNR